MPELEVLRSLAELEALVPAWERLWRGDRGATTFQTPAWLLAWWHQFGQPDLRVLVWRDGGELLGLLPLYVLAEEKKLLLLGAGTSDYLDGVWAPGFESRCVLEGLGLLAHEGGWDRLDVMQLRPESPLYRVLEAVQGGERFAGEACSTLAAVRAEELPTKIRRNFLYYRNRASRAGVLQYALAGQDDWREVWETLVRLHTARWQAAGEPGVLADRKVLLMHEEAIPAMLATGVLRLGALRLSGEVIAAMYSFADPEGRPERRQYLYLPAFSAEHAEFRPGTLLLGMLIDTAAREGIAVIDMLRGDEGYKQLWHVEPAPTLGFSVAREALPGVV